jgi:phospholipase/carboxylesterase
MKLSVVEIHPQAEHRHTVFWLHGLGADGHDFEAIVPELRLARQAHIRFVFPNAPVQPVTVNGGMKMRAWFDVLDTALTRKADIDGIYRSAALLDELIRREIAQGTASKNILLAGFSQGGVIALHSGLRFPEPLAGIAALSTYLPTAGQLQSERSTANRATPIFMAHGRYDPVIPLQAAQQSLQALQALLYPVVWKEYAMQHSVCMEEIGAIAKFIDSVFCE